MTDFKTIMDKLSNGDFRVLIELYLNVTSMVKEFLYSNPKIALLIVVVLIVLAAISFIKKMIPLLIIGAVLILGLYFPEVLDQIRNIF
ncbi:hypothetical protein [Enterococcus sp. HMSC076E04]|uniref:hypothetical protein n=1 Tax=Enterococcus TaxID=1350 RepID=UPI0008A42C80|nr:hypothetical protein [Enterococcus sp. HMSC076E04]HBL2025542.1 hypothetical protein [Enterococcus faecium]OFQ02062.1 hypothetical protein HMPREF2961_00315 [Enterococcus sp. HMSC076E04]HBL3726266.1 hypothetical protein [Enterococcus faecium]HCR3107361.1 hypothetical protein [Enterococcus faecium]HCR4229789.1 hypothetical protein [Enterococcus faecium]